MGILGKQSSKMRVKFNQGQQEQFIEYCLQNLKINLRGLANKIDCNYESLKKYHQEVCFIDECFFNRICKLVGIKAKELDITLVEDNWGPVKGGKTGILKMREKYKEKLRLWQSKGGKNRWR